MRVLISGLNGFAGSHLARKLVKEGHDVHGTMRVRSDLHRIADIKDQVTLHLVELSDYLSVKGVMDLVKPDQVYHLAAQSYVKSSWDAPTETYQTSTIGTVNVLEAARTMEKIPEILVVSTSEIYGDNDGMSDENTTPNPNTHYGIAKYTQDLMARMYHKAYHMPIVVTRAFNITGDGRSDAFADSSFAKQIAEIEKGKKEPVILHGNLDTERVFVDVEDAVNGYVLAMDSKRWGEVFCFGNDHPVRIKDLLDTLISLSVVKVETKVDPSRFRPIDTRTMKCDATKAREVLGWKQTVPFEDSMKNLLNYWRNRT